MAAETKAAILADLNPADILASKLIARNTIKYSHRDGSTRYRFHHTDIVIQHADSTLTLTSGGWKTTTTKARISAHSPCNITAIKGIWYAAPGMPFFDGMRVDHTGKPLDSPRIDRVIDDLRLGRHINAFCAKLITLPALPAPDRGDCLFCAFQPRTAGKPRMTPHAAARHAESTTATLFCADPADPRAATDHLYSHIQEGYLHGSLLMNAMRWTGYTDQSIAMHYQMNFRDSIRRALRSYLRHAFGLVA